MIVKGRVHHSVQQWFDVQLSRVYRKKCYVVDSVMRGLAQLAASAMCMILQVDYKYERQWLYVQEAPDNWKAL